MNISLETAKLAQEKGYSGPYTKVYDNGKLINKPSFSMGSISDFGTRYVPSVSQSELQKWLRDVHKIYVSPMFIGPDTNRFQYRMDANGENGEYSEWFDSWEDCLEAGLLAALKLL